jgi:hypothetical protein
MLHERAAAWRHSMAGQKLLLLLLLLLLTMFGWAVFVVPTLTPSLKNIMSIYIFSHISRTA